MGKQKTGTSPSKGGSSGTNYSGGKSSNNDGFDGRDFFEEDYGYSNSPSKSGNNSGGSGKSSSGSRNSGKGNTDWDSDNWTEDNSYSKNTDSSGSSGKGNRDWDDTDSDSGGWSDADHTSGKGSTTEPSTEEWPGDNEGGGSDFSSKYAEDDYGPEQGNGSNNNASKQAEGNGGAALGRQPGIQNIWRVWSWTTTRMQMNRDRTRRELQRVRDMGLTDVVLHVNSGRDTFNHRDFRFMDGNSRQRMLEAYEMAAEMIRHIDADVHLMVFPAPRTSFIESMIEEMAPILERIEPRSLLLDAEGNWRRNPRQRDFDGSVELIENRLKPLLRDKSIALGFTDFTMNAAGRQLASVCDYVMPQAYSTTANDGNREPGEHQDEKYELYSPLNKPIVMALAAWKVRRQRSEPRQSAFDAMNYTLDHVSRNNNPDIKEVAYWSIPASRSARYNNAVDQRDIARFMQHAAQRARRENVFVPGARFL